MDILKLQNTIFETFIELFVWNKQTRSRIKADRAKMYLRRYLDFALKHTAVEQISKDKDGKHIIWQYWHQGIENAPLIVQKCVESVKICHSDCDIRVLSFDTISNYIQIPQRYYDLLEQKKMSIAHFSDILKLYLLTTYGGTWVDATLYFTDRIPQRVFDSDFCTVEKNPATDNFGDRMSCYFIHARQDSIWAHLTKNTLDNYWSENDCIIHSFIFEHIVSMIAESTPMLQSDWSRMHNIKDNNLVHLKRFLYEDFDEMVFERIKNKAFMHKLSHKPTKEQPSGKSFYDIITSV